MCIFYCIALLHIPETKFLINSLSLSLSRTQCPDQWNEVHPMQHEKCIEKGHNNNDSLRTSLIFTILPLFHVLICITNSTFGKTRQGIISYYCPYSFGSLNFFFLVMHAPSIHPWWSRGKEQIIHVHNIIIIVMRDDTGILLHFPDSIFSSPTHSSALTSYFL